MFQKPPPRASADFERVRSLPVRGPEFYPQDVIDQMTRALRTPEGVERLFDVQARALWDFGMSMAPEHGGRARGFFPIKVGGGKSLLTFLMPRVMKAQRPMLILPAKLVEETQRKIHDAQKNWRVSRNIRIYSYERIGRVEGAKILERENPDLIMLDEAHRVKNPRAAVTRRVDRYVRAPNRNVVVAILTGTPMKDSIKNFAHLFHWTHGRHAPVPLAADAVTEWAEALDEGLNPLERRSEGCLGNLWPGAENARKAFQARMGATLGVVSADAKNDYGGSLYIRALEYNPNEATEANFKKLREEMARPDGYALGDAMQVWGIARMLALGLHYEWQPSGPDDWMQARKQWAAFARNTLADPSSARAGIDSELQVRQGVIKGDIEDRYGLLADWEAIKPTFVPNPIPVWHDRTALDVAAKWLAEHPRGIAWTEHTYFARELSRLTKAPYFGQKGLSADGTFILDAPAGPIIASRPANGEGRNLQAKWSDCLFTAPPCDSDTFEQTIARVHRTGQHEDEVNVDVMVGCRENLESVPRALSAADVKRDLLGFDQKLRVAEYLPPWPVFPAHRGNGFRWA